MNKTGQPGRRGTGKGSLFYSFCNAFRGVWDCLCSERNMRIHLAACCYVVFFALRMSLSRGELAVLFLAIGSVMCAEAMNTAVEKLCDFTEKRLTPQIRLIKDVAAGAVLLSALAALLAGGAIFLRPALWTCLASLAADPLSLALLALSAGAAFAFIILGPAGLADLFRKKP